MEVRIYKYVLARRMHLQHANTQSVVYVVHAHVSSYIYIHIRVCAISIVVLPIVQCQLVSLYGMLCAHKICDMITRAD